MIKNRVARSLYRSLLKTAKNFDETPACKALLYRTDLYNTNKSVAAKYYTVLLSQLFEKDSYLFQPKDGSVSLAELIRVESRAVTGLISTADRLDAGFAALRKLSSLWSIYNMQENDEEDEDDSSDPMEPFTVLNSDVSLATNLSSGVLLLAHPMLQGPLHRSVILLLEHNSKGSYGVVINHRTGHSVRSSVKNLPENILETFGSSSVAFGGMVRRLTYLHNVSQVGGISIPTCKRPLYAGGEITKALAFIKEQKAEQKALHAAMAAAAAASTSAANNNDNNNNISTGDTSTGGGNSSNSNSNKLNSNASSLNSNSNSSNLNSESGEESEEIDPVERFRFFVGCCLWEGGNLEKELASGYWIPTHSEPDTVLELAMLTTVLPDIDDCDLNDDNIGSEKENIVTENIVSDNILSENIVSGIDLVVGMDAEKNSIIDEKIEKIDARIEKIDARIKKIDSIISGNIDDTSVLNIQSSIAKELGKDGKEVVKEVVKEGKEVSNKENLAYTISEEIRNSLLDKNDENKEYYSDEEEEYSVDVWKALLRSLGEPYAAMADLPPWVSAKDVESADWK